MNKIEALCYAFRGVEFPTMEEIIDGLNEQGFDIIAMPSVDDHAAGFGEVPVSQKPTYDELVAFIKNLAAMSLPKDSVEYKRVIERLK